VRVCCQGKGIATGTPAAGEEWTSGPYAVLASVAVLTRLPGDTATEFLDTAAAFCNERLLGDLGAALIAVPGPCASSGRGSRPGSPRLRYGTVAVNC
jgi:hypothetical protein